MSTELSTLEPQSAPQIIATPPRPVNNPLDAQPTDFREALSRRGENRRALIEWVRSSLVDGVDYGSVPLRRGGVSKPSLRKPGAEKICGMLGVTASFPTLKDYEAAAIEGREVRHVILRCHLLGPEGQVVADGVGARSLEQDHGDMNKALKMAVKSAMIDATLRMAGLSEIFTQDLEDMPQDAFDGDTGGSSTPAQPESGSARDAGSQRGGGTEHAARGAARSQGRPGWQHAERLATERQVRLVRLKLDQMHIPESEFLQRFGIPEVTALPFSRVNEALDWITGVAA